MENDKYIGRLLDGRYEILEPIGFGGMAVVYKARCHRLNRLVAIKILKEELGKDDEFRNRFHAESQAVAMLSHPNIMSVYDVSTHEDADYIVMELIDGITLKQYMEKKGTLNWKETLHFSMQIAKALEHAHGRGIVHRDIKPHNVMVLKNGSVKVTDFGIARLMSQSNTLTKEALGSVHYISPEQAKGGRVDNRSDLYSLGVVMYEMMTGRAPYDGDTPVAVAIQHINGGAVMPSVLNPNIPGGLEQIIMKCMATDPGQRYSSATALLYDLEELRKNPEILFGFGAADALDEVLKVYPGKKAQQTRQPQPRTTAERVAGVRTDRPAQSAARTAPAATQVRTRQPRQESERRQNPPQEERSENRRKALTTTVVICSAVAVIAIIIFLVMLFNGGMLGNNNTLVPVPNLVGQIYDELDITRYPTVEIVLADYDYDEEIEAGVIMKQSPKAGDNVPLNSKVKVWVSMGPEQAELNPQLSRLTGRPKEDALNYISAFNLLPLVQEEFSEEMAEGLVIRAEPAEPDKTLEEGDTILVFVSLGKEVKTALVPEGLIGEKYSDAITVLNNNGFQKVTPREEASLEEKGTVTRLSVEPGSEIEVTTEIIVYYSSGEIIEYMPNVVGLTEAQARETLDGKGFKKVSTQEEYDDSVAAGRVIRSNIVASDRVDVTTTIILTISKGPEPTEPPATSKPTEPTEVTKVISIALPTDRTEAYNLSIWFEEEMVVHVQLSPDTATYEFSLTGSGTGTFEIWIDDELLRTEKVDFGA
ncbi:MAG: Stk1 family PASTA domain-containing Ser/Thr kinase [Oscillospiraceae bacterium]|nr:Stk1 family PASTA domain-containing Ser/Thr kinase [Oscillospiraceae bacterium]